MLVVCLYFTVIFISLLMSNNGEVFNLFYSLICSFQNFQYNLFPVKNQENFPQNTDFSQIIIASSSQYYHMP